MKTQVRCRLGFAGHARIVFVFAQLSIHPNILHFIFSPPKARSSSSPSRVGDIAGGMTVLCPSEVCASSKSGCVAGWPAFTGSSIFSSLSNHPGATLLFSASSLSLILSSHSLMVLCASSCPLRMCACSALHDATMSSGRAPCPLEEITYCGFSLELESTVTDGGSVEGTLL
jgi:hypothetical protein